MLVAAPAPGGGLPHQRLGIRDALSQALPDQDAVLACGHVQPAGVLGRVHPRQLLADAARGGGVVAVVQHAGLVDVEVVADPRDAFGGRKGHVPQFLEDGSEVRPLAMAGHLHHAPAQAGRRHHAQVAVAVAFVFVVLAGRPAGPGGLRGAHMRRQCLGQFVHADHRRARVQRALIGVQHRFHGTDEIRVGRGFQAPRLRPPRLQCVFCRVCRTVSLAIESTTCRAPSWSASNCRVQHAWPAGAGPQASLTSSASPTPSRRRGLRA